MAFTINIKGKDLAIKFNFGLMFKVNKELATTGDDGVKQENGAGQLFMDITERKDSALINLIRIASGDKKLTDDAIIDAISEYADEHGYEEMYEEIEAELLSSGFFMQKIEKTLADMKFGHELLKDTEDKDQQTQVKAVAKVVERLENRISLHNAQK